MKTIRKNLESRQREISIIQANKNRFIKNASKILLDKYKFKKYGKYAYKGRIREENNGRILFDNLISIDLESILNGKLPIVKEIENKIPNNLENHKYTINNSFCFGVGLHERIIYNKMVKDFEWFFEKQIKGFLSAAAHMDIFGKWGAEEFTHNEIKARQESIYRLIGFNDFTKNGIELLEKNILTNEGNCYCGSKKLYKECHLIKIKEQSKNLTKYDFLVELNVLKVKMKIHL